MTFDADEAVSVAFNGSTLFGGTITTPSQAGFGGVGLAPITTAIDAQDHNAFTERRVVTATIPAGTLKAALIALAPYYTPYGITLDAAQADGPTLPTLVYDMKPLTEVFAELELVSGYLREVSASQVLGMYANGTVVAPFDITDGDGNIDGDLQIRPTRTGYANRVMVRAGSGQAVVPQTWTADGSATSWVADIAAAGPGGYGVVTLTPPGNLYCTVDDGSGGGMFSWDWPTHTLTSNIGAPAAGVVLSFPYLGQYPFTVQAPAASSEPTAEQTAHGLWEIVVTAPDVFDAARAQATADAELAKRLAAATREAKYTTYRDGLRPGMTQTINSATRHVNSSFVITQIHVTDKGPLLRYEVTAIEGPTIPGSFRDTYVSWGGGSTVVAAAPANTGVSVSSALPPVHALGGSRVYAVRVPA